MTSYEGKYDKFKVSLSLGTDKLYISALDEVTYDFYDLDVTNMIFNNDNIKLKQLFNIIRDGFNTINNTKLNLELSNKCVKLTVLLESTYFSLNHTFELAKQLTETTGTRELKKELFELRKLYELLKKEIHQKALENTSKHDLYKQEINKSIATLETKQESLEVKKIKENSIIPLINITIDENQVEINYKWFLDWLKPQINPNATSAELLTQKQIPNTQISGYNTLNNLGWIQLTFGHNWNGNQVIQQCCPEKSLYYYLRKRNIDIWKDQGNNMYWMYTI